MSRARSDELIYSIEKPLNEIILDLINNPSEDYITCIGYEVIEMKGETSLNKSDEIFKNRNMAAVLNENPLQKQPKKRK